MDETFQFVNTLLYESDEGAVSINVVIDKDNETMWATQKTMAELFNVSKSTISEHLKHIFEEGELNKNSTVRKIRTVQIEGNREVKRQTTFYNLDAIISVGYRVNSKNATHFRIWATRVLKEFMVKGFVLDDELLKMELVLVKITLMNSWKGFVKSDRPNEEFMKKLQIFSQHLLIIILMQKLQLSFSRMFNSNYIMQFRV